MTTEQKIGQFFFPAVFINDSEENIQATEHLIREYNIGGLTFFHSRASAATNYEGNKKIEFNEAKKTQNNGWSIISSNFQNNSIKTNTKQTVCIN
mgnify:CR=1 FL=1